jgi:hypothetical protein
MLWGGRCLAADGPWICVQSPHFTVLTQASVGHAHEWAMTMEQFYRGMNAMFHARGPQPPRVTVVLFKDNDDFDKYKPLENGKPAELAGFFLRGDGLSIMALGLDDQSDEVRRTIQHEAVHWYFSTRGIPLPLWLEEGVAEVYSTFDMIDDNTCRFGEVVGSHLSFLTQVQLLPVRRLVRLPRSAIQYNETIRTGIVYAESWALAHYLIFGNDARISGRAGGLNRYVGSLFAGPPTEQDFVNAFGFNYAQADERLHDYIWDGQYHEFQFKLPSADVERTLLSFPASPGEIDLAMGSLLFGNRSPAEGEPLLRRAAAEMPRDPRPWQLLGETALRDSRFSEAADDFKKAVAAGAGDYFVYFSLASAEIGEISGGAHVFSTGDGEGLREPAALLRKSIGLNPAFLPAYQNLAGLIPGMDEIEPQDMAIMQFAARLYPEEDAFKVAGAAVMLKTGREAEGRRILTDLVMRSNSGHPSTAADLAENLLEKAAHKDFQGRLWQLQIAKDNAGIIALIDETEASGYFPEPKRMLDQVRRQAADFQRIEAAQKLTRAGKIREAEDTLQDLIAESDISPQGDQEATRMLKALQAITPLRH